MALAQEQAGPRPPVEAPPEAPVEVRQRVFLPPPPILRELAQPQQIAPPRPTPPPDAKDRISIGAPSQVRDHRPLILERDRDLTQTRKGTADGALDSLDSPPDARAAVPAPAPRPLVADGLPERPERGLRLPPGLGRLPSGSGGQPAPISESLRNLDRRLQASAALGAPSGTAQQIGPLHFDPQGADFTQWTQHFSSEVYRNWIIPQPALMGFKGRVEIEFTVERDGRVSSVRVLQASGTPAFDRAAQNALLGSRLLPLPADFKPAQATMLVIFFYNMAPTPEGA